VAVALLRIGRKALKNPIMWCIAAAAFTGIFFFQISFPLIILGAALLGFLGERIWPSTFIAAGAGKVDKGDSVLSDDEESPAHARPSWSRALRISVVCFVLWWTPVLVAGLWLGWNHTLFKEGLFFSKAAVVTFGGAYAVLPYVAQQAVDTFGWLQTGQMMDGLGLAETTPGPLIMVLQFVGFMGGWQKPGLLPPLLAGTLGALITTWVTFVPCFLWILLGAPHIEQLRGNARLTAALSAVTAAVVGVILNLAVWFGMHALFPVSEALDLFALVVGAITFVGMLKWNWNIIPVVIGSGLAGLIYQLAI
jgi:chromate transporter